MQKYGYCCLLFRSGVVLIYWVDKSKYWISGHYRYCFNVFRCGSQEQDVKIPGPGIGYCKYWPVLVDLSFGYNASTIVRTYFHDFDQIKMKKQQLWISREVSIFIWCCSIEIFGFWAFFNIDVQVLILLSLMLNCRFKVVWPVICRARWCHPLQLRNKCFVIVHFVNNFQSKIKILLVHFWAQLTPLTWEAPPIRWYKAFSSMRKMSNKVCNHSKIA